MILLLIAFSVLNIIGIILIRSFISENRLSVIIPAGFFFAVSIYITLLNLNYNLFPGPIGITLSNIEMIGLGAFGIIRFRHRWSPLDWSRSKKILFLMIALIIFIFSFARMTNTLSSTESGMQWGYAASFAKGNYPLMVPWQPDVVPNYHVGAYFFEGAFQNLSGLPLRYVRAILNTFLFGMNFIFAIFLFWHRKYGFKNLWLIFAGLTLFVSFGVILLSYPNFTNQMPSIDLRNLEALLSEVPVKQERAGGPLIDIHQLSFLPARAVNLGLSLLIFMFMFAKFKTKYSKAVSLSVVLAAMSFIEETIFFPIFFTLIIILFLSVIPKIKSYFEVGSSKVLFFITFLSGILASLHGGFISFNLFERKEAVYKFLGPFNEQFLLRLDSLKDVIFTPQNFNVVNLLVLNPLWIVFILFIYAIYKKDKIIGSLAILSAVTFIVYLSLDYIYCGTCPIRIRSHGYLIAGYGFILMIFQIFRNLNLKQNIFGGIVIFMFLLFPTLIPPIISEGKILKKSIDEGTYKLVLSNFNLVNPRNVAIKWAGENLPPNSRILVLDREYPGPPGSINFTYGGLYAIYSPQFIRVNRQQPGPEFFDLAMTLNPSLIKKAKVQYIYIESFSTAYENLTDERKRDLQNEEFFSELTSAETEDAGGANRLYKLLIINDAFLISSKVKEFSEGTLMELRDLIPGDSSVYIEDYPALDIWYRMAIILTLKDNRIFIKNGEHGYGLIETTFNFISENPNGLYDYYILPLGQSPQVPSKQIWSNMFASAWKKI